MITNNFWHRSQRAAQRSTIRVEPRKDYKTPILSIELSLGKINSSKKAKYLEKGLEDCIEGTGPITELYTGNLR